MGIGDELIAMGQARRLLLETGLRGKVEIVDKEGRRREHYLWQRCGYIARAQDRAVATIVNGRECRPYVDYERTTKPRWAWNLSFRPYPAKLWPILPDSRASGRIILEPAIKSTASPNKQWGQWQALVDAAPHLPWAQIGSHGTEWLRGVRRLPAPSFLDAVALLAAADCAVLPEGGLHHAAAAVGCRAVVLFGAYIPPALTGYDCHTNLGVDDPEAQGWRSLHERCEAAWKLIPPSRVLSELQTLR